MSRDWPEAELDPIRRLRVLAATTPGALYHREIVLPVPFDRVWAVASDLERELPVLLSTVRSFTVTAAEGERLRARAVGTLGQRAEFEVVLREGWCLMRSRFVVGAMAATPEGDGTRFGSLGGFRVPGARLLRPVLGGLGDRAVRRLAEHPALRG
ncbi:SRPBCC family protein [Kitasatospora sp. NPDC057015]|uniref:SRPBCC family protein n=1 Tax=Kitasatospora sp. NPDC057015 TaxID=3346001 RepID=UPI003631DB70